VRELQNLMHRKSLLEEGQIVSVNDSDLAVEANETEANGDEPGWRLERGFQKAKAAAVAEFERNYLVRALSDTHGNVTLAARIAGKERRSFGKLLKKHGIDTAPYRCLESGSPER